MVYPILWVIFLKQSSRNIFCRLANSLLRTETVLVHVVLPHNISPGKQSVKEERLYQPSSANHTHRENSTLAPRIHQKASFVHPCLLNSRSPFQIANGLLPAREAKVNFQACTLFLGKSLAPSAWHLLEWQGALTQPPETRATEQTKGKKETKLSVFITE